MPVVDLARKTFSLFGAGPSAGVTPVPYLGALCCCHRHRLRRVALSQSAAVLVLEGRKTVFRADEHLSVPAGEMFLLPGRMEVNIENDPDGKTGRYLAFCLSLTDDVLGRVMAAAAPPDPAPAATLSYLKVAVDQPLFAAVGHLLDMATACPANERLLALCLEEVVLLAAERTAALPLVFDAATAWHSRVARLIGQDPGREWSAGEVAGRLATSERSLRRCLEAEGTSLRKVYQDVRLAAALSLLQSGRVTVGEAASRCGYQSPSRFAVRFKERFGASPSDILRFGAVSAPSLAV